jgi:pimeloyl-ACP methyl ester carboxylesterase
VSIVLPKSGLIHNQPRARGQANRLAQLTQELASNAQWRWKFASLWVRRALGVHKIRTVSQGSLDDGLTFVLSGIEGASKFAKGMGDGLAVGGVPGVMRLYDWGMPFPGGFLGNLTRVDRNRKRAADLAREIVAYQDLYPGRPVHLLAQSGGAGIAVWATETLPEGRMIDGIVILGGALSPRYDLRKALARCRKGILNSHSHKDWLVLGVGTRFFGTTDRQFCDACGRVGFEVPENLDRAGRALYAKLHQIPWTPDLGDSCSHWGGHLTSACEEYLVSHIAPWVLADR